jgi:SH3-like domain-containing protein
MKKSIFVLALSLFCLPLAALAGTCEGDTLYERDNSGAPNIAVWLRNRPCMQDSTIMKTLPANEEVQIIAETDGWYKVKDKNGAIGWAGSALIRQTSQSSTNNVLPYEYFAKDVNPGSVALTSSEASKILSRTKGYILLQVQSHGEAWYVDPISSKRVYMKDGTAAYEIMRSYGLGISNANLEKLKKGDYGLINRLKGRIVLQVEAHGEAYYIHPKTGEAHYLANGAEAYRIMRELGLGITNRDLSAVVEKK